MRRADLVKAVVAVMMIAIIMFAMVIHTDASEQYIVKKFEVKTYAPIVMLEHGAFSKYSAEVQNDGSIAWKKTDKSKTSQMFEIVPSPVPGYYVMYEVSAPYSHSKRALTYTSSGFKMEYPEKDRYQMPMIKKTQMFKLVWYENTTSSGRTVKQCWRLSCYSNKIAFCTGGWSVARIYQINAPD